MKLKWGDRVINQDGLLGFVSETGPHKDPEARPFTILSDGRQWHCGIQEDGTSNYSDDLWIKVETVEAMKEAYNMGFEDVFIHVRAR